MNVEHLKLQELTEHEAVETNGGSHSILAYHITIEWAIMVVLETLPDAPSGNY